MRKIAFKYWLIFFFLFFRVLFTFFDLRFGFAMLMFSCWTAEKNV